MPEDLLGAVLALYIAIALLGLCAALEPYLNRPRRADLVGKGGATNPTETRREAVFARTLHGSSRKQRRGTQKFL